jgi:pyridoxine 5-phosphate synthase
MRDAGIPTSLFIGADRRTVDQARTLAPPAIELHTGPYVHDAENPRQVTALRDAAQHAASLGMEVHAGHGLTTQNVGPVAAIPEIVELHIGHSVISRAVFVGLVEAVHELRAAMDAARAQL